MQFIGLRSAETLGTPPLFCKDLGGGYTPLLGKNYSPPKNLLISAKIEKWAIFGMPAHLWLFPAQYAVCGEEDETVTNIS